MATKEEERHVSAQSRFTAAAPFRCWRALVDTAAIVTVAGELDIATAPVVDWQLRVAAREAPLVVLDLRALEVVDLIGARLMVTVHRRIGHAGGRFVVACDDRRVRRVLELIGAEGELELVQRPSEVLVRPDLRQLSEGGAARLVTDAEQVLQMLARAAGAGIDPRRVLLALGFRVREPALGRDQSAGPDRTEHEQLDLEVGADVAVGDERQH